MRTAAFQSQYNVTCDSFKDSLTKDYLQTLLEHKKDKVQKFCKEGSVFSLFIYSNILKIYIVKPKFQKFGKSAQIALLLLLLSYF